MTEYFRLLFEDGVAAIGELVARHKLFAVPNAQFDGPYRDMVLSLLLLGDPELRIRFGTGSSARAAVRGVRPEASQGGLGLVVAWANAARDRASIELDLPAGPGGESVEIAVFDLAGRRVRAIHNGPAPAGSFATSWDLRDGSGHPVEQGMYFVRARLGGWQQARRLLVIR
jgi:hypothetical protein